MAGYSDTYELIVNALMGRPDGQEIQPDEHQAYALNMLEYIRSLELVANGPLIGIAEADTVPVQPDDSRACYIAGIAQDRTVTFQNFYDVNGEQISVTTGSMEAYLIILIWNTEYWEYLTVPASITSSAENAYFYYHMTIRKTYGSIAEMEADVDSPIGNDGGYIQVGEIVTVYNENDESENGVWSYEVTDDGTYYWQKQASLTSLASRVFDCGRADTQYGGAREINCGDSSGAEV